MEQIKLPKGGNLYIYKNYLSAAKATKYFDLLYENLPWEQSDIFVYGKHCKTPRFQCWMGNENVTADVYSKNRVDWDPKLFPLKKQLEEDLDFTFNYLLLNLYKTGANYISFHADDEVLTPTDLIGSLSLGGTRRFIIKERISKQVYKELILEHGDLIVMDGEMQAHYKHSVPKTAKSAKPRINLTWRRAKEE